MTYEDFLRGKLRRAESWGFEPEGISTDLFAFQRDLVRWALRRGRAAIFASTGLGKSRVEIEWARHVAAHTGGRVLILTPLAVAPQMVAEGEKIGVQVDHCRDGAEVRGPITVTNYDRLHRFDPAAFAGVVLDESSCIKHEDSKTLARLLEAFSETPFRLSATATPAPNDYTELGTQAEFLGACSRMEMLSEFFVHDGGETQSWRLKGHAQREFWRWVASWAALVRKPSDLGYDDGAYELPALDVATHLLAVDESEVFASGRLFAVEARGLAEQRAAKRASLARRVALCAETVMAEPGEAWVVWGELNAETEALTRAIPGAVEVRGTHPAEEKEARLAAFARGEIRVLVSKPSICGWGLNWQHAARMAFVGVSHSWELYHQAVRRIWRFGQSRPVAIHVFAGEEESSVVSNLARKERDAERMGEELSAETREFVREQVRGRSRVASGYAPKTPLCLPAWIHKKAEVAS
jgi:superfamily II DNA or RNA helicase